MEKLIAKTKLLGWSKNPINLEVDPRAGDKAKLMLLGNVLSSKVFSRLVVVEKIAKAWNTTNEVEVSVVDKNVFLFSFKHEVDVRRVWDRRPWSFKGEHLILKKYDPSCSFNKVDFSVSDFWVQIHGLPLNRQNDLNLKKIGGMMGQVLDWDLVGNGLGAGKRYVRVRVVAQIST
jgi:hypothetical protein